MTTQLRPWWIWLVISLATLSSVATPARAITRAGTHIDNTAFVLFTFEGQPERRFDSPLVRLTVASLPAVSLTPSHDRVVYPGQSVVLPHQLRNTGNVPLAVRLTLAPGQWQSAVLVDRNGNGLRDPEDSPVPDVLFVEVEQTLSLLAIATVPADSPDGATDSFTLTATDAGNNVSASVTNRLTVRTQAPATIHLVANPQTILGNGKDRSLLTATVLTASGAPVPDGTPVTFTTQRGTFENGLQTLTLTTRNGVASTYLTAEIVSTTPVTAIARVIAGTPLTGTAEAEVYIVFSPAAIFGLVSDYSGYRPVPNVPATIFAPDGSVVGTVITGEDGSYLLFIPREGTYTLELPVVNSVGDTVLIRQRVNVDRLGGAVFYPEGAIVGVVMDINTRQPVANAGLEFTLEAMAPARSRALAPGDKVQIQTDARGGFVLSGLALGRYRFRVTSADEHHYPYGHLEVDLTRAGEYIVNADILLDPFGYVYDSETGARVENALVTLLRADTGDVVRPLQGDNPTRTAANGTYWLLPGPGQYRLRVEAEGYRTFEGTPFQTARDTVSVNVPLQPLPALTLAKSVDKAEAQPGEVLQYTLVASNTGLGTARNVAVVDVLPAQLTPVAESLGGGTSYDADSRRLIWPIGDLPRLTGVATIRFQVRVDSVMPEGITELVNSAYVIGDGIPEPGAAPGVGLVAPVVAAPVSVRVVARPRLEITKTADPPVVAVGDTVRFTIRFRNTGNGIARNVVISDTLPAGLALADASQSLTWHLGWLEPGVEEERQVECVAQASGLEPGLQRVTNRVSIQSATSGPVEATAEIQILVPYLKVTKRALVSEAESGDVVPFEICVENLSPTTEATQVEIRDLLPSILHYRPGTSRMNGQPAPDPDRSGATLTWRLERLPARTQVRLTFHTVVAVGHGHDEDIVNGAEAEGMAPTGQRVAAPPSRTSVRRRVGFFSDRGILIGRLFVDANGNRMPDPDEIGVANVALYTDTGLMAVSDGEGKYVIPDVTPGVHVLRVDLTTIPAGYQMTIIDSANTGRPWARIVRLQRGGLAKANFAFVGEGKAVGTARPGTPLLMPPEEARR